jgi:hypothetical protein
MSSKSKWDQPGPSATDAKPEDSSKATSDAAATAAAIAAKIAAQFASGALKPEYTQDIDINDIRNRYMLTRQTTQDDVCIIGLEVENVPNRNL